MAFGKNQSFHIHFRQWMAMFIQIPFIFVVATHKDLSYTMAHVLKSYQNHNLFVFQQNWHCHEESKSLVLSFSIQCTLLVLLLHSLNSPAHCCKSSCLTWSWIFNSFLLSCCPWSKIALIHLPSKQGQAEGKGKCIAVSLQLFGSWLFFFKWISSWTWNNVASGFKVE